MAATHHLRLAAGAPRGQHAVRVVIADDRSMVRRSLRLLLEGEDGIGVVAETGDIASVLHHVHGHEPHVLVLDLQMPNGSSIEMIRRLRAQAPRTEIVVLTMEASPVFARRALEAGARGYVLKEHAAHDVVEAVRAAARAHEFVSPRVAAGLAALRRASADDGLTPREVEVLRLTALGYTGEEIARRLHLSRRTIESHRATIHRKLGLAGRAELVSYALARRLISS